MAAPTVRILCGHALDMLKTLPDKSVHCVVTSPPYWGLRDYSRCECTATYDGGPHSGYDIKEGHLSPRPKTPNPDCPKCHGTGKDDSLEVDWADGWHGQLGLEPTPELYVRHIVQVFQEVRRVLRDDGTLWLNIGDCYTGGKGEGGGIKGDEHGQQNHSFIKSGSGLKPKDLVGMPWRVAFALQTDGWYLRSDIIWAKSNPMPESVTDRPTKAHEYVFLLSKSARYFYDANAVREPHKPGSILRDSLGYAAAFKGRHTMPGEKRPYSTDHNGFVNPHGRNLRTVWTIPTQPYPEAHFATFPEKLVEPCIKAGCPKDGTVLDPFAGSGTVGAVARSLGRSAILIEIKEQYIKLLKERVEYAHKALESFQ